MIQSVDQIDYLAGLRLRGASNDNDLKQSIETAIISYNTFLDVINEVVEFSPATKSAELTPPLVS